MQMDTVINRSSYQLLLLGDEEDDDYKPSISDTSSVILVTMCCVCTLASLMVSYCVHKIGAQTASSKLILYLTLTHANLNFAKTPFLFNQIPYGCHLSGVLFFYSYAQIYIIAYYMLNCSYTLLLEGNLHAEIAPTESRRAMMPSDYELNNTSKCFIVLVPLFALVLPLSFNVFEEKFNWCGINPDSHYGFLVFVQYIIIFAVTSVMAFYQLYLICTELRRVSTYSTEIFYRFFKGEKIH
jgi:hypothetical protein